MSDAVSSEQLATCMSRGHLLAEARDFHAARAEYLKIVDELHAPAEWRSLAQMCVAQCNTRIGDYRGAKAAYEQVKAIEGGPAHHAKEADERIREIERLRAGLPARDPQASRVQFSQRPAPSVTLHVAVDGDDTNPGTKDSPFATIERARDDIRALKAKGPLSDGGVTVLIGDGEYKVADTFHRTH